MRVTVLVFNLIVKIELKKVLIYWTGVDHSQLVDLAKAAFSFLPNGEPAAKEASKYHGGNA